VILLHDNAPPYVAKATKSHDYHLSRSLQHHLTDTHFKTGEAFEKTISVKVL
ncbi:hypothetical protein WH47_10110, partial [Habropoda laboriosa]